MSWFGGDPLSTGSFMGGLSMLAASMPDSGQDPMQAGLQGFSSGVSAQNSANQNARQQGLFDQQTAQNDAWMNAFSGGTPGQGAGIPGGGFLPGATMPPMGGFGGGGGNPFAGALGQQQGGGLFATPGFGAAPAFGGMPGGPNPYMQNNFGIGRSR